MIYQFRCQSMESRHFRLEIDADGRHSFLELHQILQQALGYQNQHIASFFIPLSRGRKPVEISQLEGPCRHGLPTMRNTMIGMVITPSVRFFRYVFDLISDRYLQIELTGTIMEKNLREPVVSLQRGESPAEVLDEVINAKLPQGRKAPEPDTDYGLLTDYYEIFGEMEELVR
ncbi:MAG TPA: hypothetical protein PKJ58_01165 [Prolixibacteraceae bacterium]|nr:hypothetical protein [Prolixibacteraceae bacterium]